MDPIQPIAAGLHPISPASGLPVEALERISRERDRPAKDGQQRRRREPPPPDPVRERDDDEHPHVDVRA
jgi:hypothetical protein